MQYDYKALGQMAERLIIARERFRAAEQCASELRDSLTQAIRTIDNRGGTRLDIRPDTNAVVEELETARAEFVAAYRDLIVVGVLEQPTDHFRAAGDTFAAAGLGEQLVPPRKNAAA